MKQEETVAVVDQHTSSTRKTDGPLQCLTDPAFGLVATIKASSTLHPRKQHAPAHVLTKDPATGWTSDGNGTTGSNTVDEEIPWLHLEWTQAVSIHEIRLQFQAGFGAGTCEILWDHDNDNDGILWEELEDVHSVQIHTFKEPRDNVTSIRLNFRDCTDFYQRLTLYRLELWGTTTI